MTITPHNHKEIIANLNQTEENPPPPQDEQDKFSPREESTAAVFERSEGARGERMNSGSRLQDNSGSLTRRLVTAQFQDMVRIIISEAYQNLGEWLKAAMNGGEDAAQAHAVIRRLNRLIRRAVRKIADLNKEDDVAREIRRAEQREHEARARELQVELERRFRERKAREQRYLADAHPPGELSGAHFSGVTNAALQAKIEQLIAETKQLAQTALALENGSTDMSAALTAGGFGGGAATISGGEISGGEIAS